MAGSIPFVASSAGSALTFRSSSGSATSLSASADGTGDAGSAPPIDLSGSDYTAGPISAGSSALKNAEIAAAAGAMGIDPSMVQNALAQGQSVNDVVGQVAAATGQDPRALQASATSAVSTALTTQFPGLDAATADRLASTAMRVHGGHGAVHLQPSDPTGVDDPDDPATLEAEAELAASGLDMTSSVTGLAAMGSVPFDIPG